MDVVRTYLRFWWFPTVKAAFSHPLPIPAVRAHGSITGLDICPTRPAPLPRHASAHSLDCIPAYPAGQQGCYHPPQAFPGVLDRPHTTSPAVGLPARHYWTVNLHCCPRHGNTPPSYRLRLLPAAIPRFP